MKRFKPLNILDNKGFWPEKAAVADAIKELLILGECAKALPVNDFGRYRAPEWRDENNNLVPWQSVDWYVYDARTGDKVYVGPVPEHLFYAAETKEEAMVMIAKFCMRPNDTTKGRASKLTHYIDLHKRLYGTMPNDIHLFVRNHNDIPITMKDEIVQILEEKGWKETRIPDPTLLPRLIRKRKEE
jgi:hypothetical protein